MKKNLVIAAAVGLQVDQIKLFIKSLRKYYNDDRTYMEDTFDYIKSIRWHWDIEE